jgi:hypothetical protein
LLRHEDLIEWRDVKSAQVSKAWKGRVEHLSVPVAQIRPETGGRLALFFIDCSDI